MSPERGLMVAMSAFNGSRTLQSAGLIGYSGIDGDYTLAVKGYVYNGTNNDATISMGGIATGSSVGIAAVGLAGGLMPVGSALNTYSARITTNTTTTPTSSTAYISTIAISVTTAGTTSTVTIKDKQGTPLTLVNALPTAALSVGDTIFNFQTPVKMVSGIDVVTAGSVAAAFSIFINYYV
jgi:hypothetical protein